ncbi:hypothetical protein E2C01_055428 [Portunus trituberculatus]|uniref:Uncharacterized protein n=1 Tax=Portunus trituberculatus TaxID=210409 RepID=A0A5B7GWS7_PORTR|nr:hypothetical protein [Portunus trituberculatus]
MRPDCPSAETLYLFPRVSWCGAEAMVHVCSVFAIRRSSVTGQNHHHSPFFHLIRILDATKSHLHTIHSTDIHIIPFSTSHSLVFNIFALCLLPLTIQLPPYRRPKPYSAHIS